ncbi:MAG: hypothetical protein KDD58_07240 [Bdellovibrionales bacterium]|nr:hypothetical protein [Bdellovibrionales bacterium]
MNKKLNAFNRHLNYKKSKLQKILNYRLAVGLSFIAIFFIASLSRWNLYYLILSTILILSLLLLVRSTRLWRKHITQIEELIKFYKRVSLRKKANYKAASHSVLDFPSHIQTLAMDLHINTELSIFNLLDESLTYEGQKKLLKSLLMPNLEEKSLLEQQKLIKDLNKDWWQLVKLRITKSTANDSSYFQINEIHRPLTGSNFSKLFGLHVILFVILWTTIISIYTFSLSLSPILFFTVYLFFALATRSDVAQSFRRSFDLSQQVLQLQPIIEFIENRSENVLFKTHFKASLKLQLRQKLNRLRVYMSFLSVEGHPMVHIVLNAICPWDYVLTYLVENWRKKIAQNLPSVLDEITDFEVLLSKTLFYHFHTQNFPVFNGEKNLSFKALRHPLIDSQKAVANDFVTDKKLILITGSNMSGKSTFLRSIGVNQMLALSGCPVFADEFNTYLAPLRTCLKVQDSLEEGLSTFYYEVRQVSEMIKSAKNGENFIYLIDEIFRGTNNRERLIGSQAVIEELIKHDVIGFISTHDLELTQLESKYSELVNYHFRDDMGEGELVFNYKIQQGPCPTTNALKIIAREGIPIK